MEVKLFIGAKEVLARARVLGAPQIEAGSEGWLQLALSEPAAIARGDRFILRRPSPGTTLGGGRVLDPHPGRRHRRFRAETLNRLRTLAQGTPAELLYQALARLEPISEGKLLQQTGMEQETAAAALTELLQSRQIVQVEQNLFTQAGWQQRSDQLQQIVSAYHQDNPLRLGIPREELRSRLKLTPALFSALLTAVLAERQAVEAGGVIKLPQHEIRFSNAQQTAVSQLLRKFSAAGVNSPSVKEVKAIVGEVVYQALVDLGEVRPLNADVIYAKAEYAQFTGKIVAYLQQNGRINAAQVRDLLHTSRKYAIALLEHLDDVKITRRVGDDRVLVEEKSATGEG